MACKYKYKDKWYSEEEVLNLLRKENSSFTTLYNNLIKELETSETGRKVFEQVKRDYKYKKEKYKTGKILLDDLDFDGDGNPQPSYLEEELERDDIEYTLEEQQEEALVTLLGLMAADKLDAKKDATLISKLKELWKQISDFVKSLLKQDGIKIDELPITTTLNDLAEIMAYGNNKIILPGYKVEYSTPLGNKYDTLEEVNNEIRSLADANVKVDLSGVKLKLDEIPERFESPRLGEEFEGWRVWKDKEDKWWEWIEGEEPEIITKERALELWKQLSKFEVFGVKNKLTTEKSLHDFVHRNKEYEQSKEIIEQWKKENNIQYDPEEVYSRGQGFYSSIGAYSNLELDLLLKNLIQHIEDNKKASGEFTISAFTRPIDKRLKHIEGTGDRVRFVIYPKSEHIKWAAPTDVYSGSVWDAHEKVSKDKKSELLGVSFTKAPALRNINEVSPNLADIIDNLSHVHNELGIELTTNNFRIEYDDNIGYSIKKLIDNINKILDDKYGKLENPDISKKETQKEGYEYKGKFYNNIFQKINENGKFTYQLENTKTGEKTEYLTPDKFKNLSKKIGKQPTQTRDNTTSIESVKNEVIPNDVYNNVSGNITTKIFESVINPEINASVDKSGNIHFFKIKESFDFHSLDEKIEVIPSKEIQEELENKINRLKQKQNQLKKEYTDQTLTNLRIAALKEVARKYPRSLITSEVVPINPNMVDNSEIQYSKKQGYNPTEITDEYGNTWTEVNLDESHLDTIHFQKAQGVQSFDEQTAKEVASVLQEVYPEISLEYTELEGLRGQANIKAGKVLIDSLNQNTDTLAHEYAHHYISWFKNSPIVQKGIRLFGSEEALVQAIGEQAVVQKAKANIWYKQFWNWIKSLFNDKQAQLERLTDSFLERKTLGEKQVRNVTHNQAVDPNSIKSDEKLIKTIDAAKLVFKNRQAELKQQYGEERAGTRESIKRIRAALEKLTEQATYSDILSVAKAQLDVARNALDKPFNEMSDADFVDVKKILYFTDEFDKLLLNAPEDEAFNRQVTQVRAETIRLQNKFDKFIKQRLVEASKAYGREITPEELEKAYDDLSTAKAMTMSLETTRIPHLQFAAAVMNWRSRQTDLEVNQFDREYRDLVKKYSEEEFKKIFDAKGHLISMYSHDFYNAQAEVYRNLRKLNDSSTKEDWMNAKREIGEWFEQNYTYKLTPEGKALFEKHLKEVEEANTFDGEVNQDAVEKFKQQYSWENKGVVNPDGSFTITKDGIPRSNIGGTNIYSDKWYAYLVKTPLEKYKNPDFEKVRDLEVYNWYVDKVQDIYSKTSPTLTSELGMYDNVIHQTKLDLTESKFQLGNTLKGIKESALDWVTVSLTYHQLNETLPNLTDEKGRPKPLIRPKSLYEIQREGQFKDPIDLLRKGFEMAVTYEHKLEIQPLLELVGYQLEKTKKIEKNPITDKIRKDLNKNPLETAGMLTKAIEAFKFRENAELTGQTRTDETSGILRDVTDEEKEQLRKDYEEWYEGGKIGPEPVLKKQSWIKYSDVVVDFTRLNLIGLKPFSALANVSIGMINNYVYAAREKDFNTKDLDWAMIKLRNSMLRFGTVNLVTNKEAMKIGSLALKFGVIKETFIEDSKEYGKNKYLKMIPQVLFLLQESGEYLIANQILLAKLHNTKIKNLAGKEKNLYEAFDEFGDWKTSEFGEAPEWNKLVHLNESGENISKLSQFRDRIDLVRHRTQGDYNTPMPLKGKWYGRIFMLFRTWLPRAIEERFGSENKYLETKGRMLTLRDAFTAKGLKGAGKFTLNTTLVTLAKLTNLPLIGEHIGKNPLAANAVESYEKYLKEIGLSDLDVENMRAQIAEFRMIILAVGLGMVFHALAGGGDDDPEVNFTVNLLQRVYQDLTFFIFPSSSFAIIKDPIPIMKTIMDGTEAINASINYMINPEKDTYKKGFRKGRSKTAKEWNELIPVLSAWNSTEATYNQIFGENTYKYTKK